VFFNVSVWLWLVPSCTFPKLKLAGFPVRAPAVAAVPLSPMLREGFEAFDVTVTVPLALPADFGAKVTLNEVLWPGVKVTGVVIPEMLKPVPETATAEIVAFSPPVFFTVSVWLELCPTVTFVNVKLAGVAVRVAAVTPVPDSARLSAVAPPTVNARFPLTAPAVVGANTTANVVLWFGVNVSGRVRPV
jgi:hypothetical protein